MEIIKLNPRGYCQGVIQALSLVKKALLDFPQERIYLLGMIVHNQLINQALISKNAILLDNTYSKAEWIDKIDDGILIISAHGINPSLIERALAKGLKIIDATCIHVKKAQESVINYLSQGYDIIYIGEKSHPEAQGIISINPQRIHLLTPNQENLGDLRITNDKIVVTTQTTLNYQNSLLTFRDIQKKYPRATMLSEICDATRLRQEAVVSAPKDVDLLLVIGDKSSNNANKLKEVAQQQGQTRVELISSVLDLSTYDWHKIKKVAITSAASTPTYLTNQVIDYLENYPNGSLPTINLEEIL